MEDIDEDEKMLFAEGKMAAPPIRLTNAFTSSSRGKRCLLFTALTVLAVVGLVFGVSPGGVFMQDKKKATTASHLSQVIMEAVSAKNYKCVPGACWSSGPEDTSPDILVGHTLSAEACMEKVLHTSPEYTGCFWTDRPGDTHSCYYKKDGHCNIFTDNGANWYSSTFLAGYTCTVLVRGVKPKWNYQKCVTGHLETYELHKGTKKTDSWTKEVNFEAAAESKGTLGYSQGFASAFEEFQESSQEVTLDGTDGQVCLWQFGFEVEGPPGFAVQSLSDEFILTPHPDTTPKCTPGRFDLSDKTYQTCETEDDYL